MDQLPDPILVGAISYLTTREVIRLVLVCHRLMQAAMIVWRHRPVLAKIDSSDQIRMSIVDPFLHRHYFLPSVNKAMLSARSVAVFNRHLIVVCVASDRSNVIYKFQPKSQSWRRMTVIPSQISHVIACLPLNKDELFIVGSESLMLYSKKAGVWRHCGRMPRLHINGTAALIDNTIVVCGGCSEYDESGGEPSPPHAKVDKYDFVRSSWIEAKDAPRQCESMASVTWNSNLVVAGGYTDVDLESLSGEVHLYNNCNDSWRSICSTKPSRTLCLFTMERSLFDYRGDNRFARYVEGIDQWETVGNQFAGDSDKNQDLGKVLMITVDASIVGDVKQIHDESGKRTSYSIWKRRLRRR